MPQRPETDPAFIPLTGQNLVDAAEGKPYEVLPQDDETVQGASSDDWGSAKDDFATTRRTPAVAPVDAQALDPEPLSQDWLLDRRIDTLEMATAGLPAVADRYAAYHFVQNIVNPPWNWLRPLKPRI